MEAEVPLQEISMDIENQEAEVPSQAMVTSVREEMDKLDPLTDGLYCIYRVPRHLRDKNPEAYTPKVVSIGPIHHKTKGLEAMEEYKQRYLQRFLERIRKSLEDYAKFVKDKEECLRERYADKIDLTSDEFVKIMMVDSAFVYEMLNMITIKIDKKDTSTKIFNRPCLLLNVIEDLMLLENQIPLFILEELFNLEKKPRKVCEKAMVKPGGRSYPVPEPGEYSFEDLVYRFINWRPEIGTPSSYSCRDCSHKVEHLLDCLRICHLSTDPNPPPSEDKTMFLSSLISRCLRQSSKPETSHLIFPVPTITELHQSGVTFADNTKYAPLLDVKFDRQHGILNIPHFFMGDSTEPVFRNLLAFEQCHYEQDRLFTDYFTLLAQLIKDPSDVDLLVRSGVLENTLGDHKRAADVINDMALGLTVSRERHFDNLRTALTKYYKQPWHKWRATLKQKHCTSPWAVISIIAAVILLALTIVQTVYAIISK